MKPILPFKVFIRSGWRSVAGLGLGVFFIALMNATQARGADWSGESIPAYDRLFQRTNGWIGADGDFTVALTNGLTLWLFSDTFVGEVREGRRLHASMIHNSAAWQRGIDPASAQVDWFYPKSATGEPASLISPADGRGYFWLFDGLMADGKLFLFLTQIESTDAKGAFGFRQIGTWLGEVANPLAPPTRWRVEQRKVPFAQFGAGDDYSFGSAGLVTNGWVYIYGTREKKGGTRMMILARAPEAAPADFSAWRFRTRDGWSTNAADTAGLCGGMATEYSVSWLPALRQYALVCTENGLSEKILLRTAPEPWGPWSAAAVVYRCPEMKWDRRVFCYAAKAHPMLTAKPDELIVTYAANSFEFSSLMNNAQLYWPRFVRVTPAANGLTPPLSNH